MKTLKDIQISEYKFDDGSWKDELKDEAIKIFKNLQTQETIYPTLLRDFPYNQKGLSARRKWDDADFKYGSEYGMLAMLIYFFNLTDEDLK